MASRMFLQIIFPFSIPFAISYYSNKQIQATNMGIRISGGSGRVAGDIRRSSAFKENVDEFINGK